MNTTAAQIKEIAHEQAFEVTSALLAFFGTPELNAITPFLPAVDRIMYLQRRHRLTVGVALVEQFFEDWNLDAENSAVRESVADKHMPLMLHALDFALEQEDKARAQEARREELEIQREIEAESQAAGAAA